MYHLSACICSPTMFTMCDGKPGSYRGAFEFQIMEKRNSLQFHLLIYSCLCHKDIYQRGIDKFHISDAGHAEGDVCAVINTDNLWIWLEGLLEHYNGLIYVCADVTRIFTREMWIKQAESIQVYIKGKNNI